MIKQKQAFTLAEVLITLAVIGVIAAITIPSIISRQNDVKLKTQFKKTYSSISQALNKTVMLDLGGNSACYHNQDGTRDISGCAEFFEKFAKNFSIIKSCSKNAKQGGCIPVYSHYENTGCAGYREGNINNIDPVYVLADKQILIIYADGTAGNPVYGNAFFAADINGFQGPNKWGYDLFGFMIERSSDKGIYISVKQACWSPASGGRTLAEMMQHAFSEN